jgi:hypothetical protein
MHTNRIKWLKGASLPKVGIPCPEGPETPCKILEVSESVIRAFVGLTTSRLDPPEEVILHKGCVLSDPYLTQVTCIITLQVTCVAIYVKKLIHHDITNAQENFCKLGPPYGKGNKAQNLESTASHRGKGTINTPIYQYIPINISNDKKVLGGSPLNQLHMTSCLTSV